MVRDSSRRMDDPDPRGLIREAYRMDIGEEECRSIFLDWALGAGAGKPEIERLLEVHGAPDHPMTAVLKAGLDAPARTGRRGGWRSRRNG